MGLKDWLKNAFSRSNENKQKYREMETDFRLHKTLQERQKNSNERELEKYYEEARQKRIQAELGRWRKQKQREFWNGNKVYKQKYMFKTERPILKERNIFNNNSRRVG